MMDTEQSGYVQKWAYPQRSFLDKEMVMFVKMKKLKEIKKLGYEIKAVGDCIDIKRPGVGASILMGSHILEAEALLVSQYITIHPLLLKDYPDLFEMVDEKGNA